MDGFDESEAEEIASNWVRNLRFRFARMGLSYYNGAKDPPITNDNGDDPERKRLTDVEERISNVGKAFTSKDWEVFDDFPSKSNTSDLSTKEVTSHNFDQDTILSARSKSSRSVDLENLREKRLMFFQQKSHSFTSAGYNDCLKSSIYDTVKPVNESQKVSNKNSEFQNDGSHTKPMLSGRHDTYNQSHDSEKFQAFSNENSKFGNGSFKTGAWGLSSIDCFDRVGRDTIGSLDREILPRKSTDDQVLGSFSLKEFSTRLPIDSSEIPNGSCRKKRVSGNISGKEEKGVFQNDPVKFESKEAPQVFPIELDDDEFDMRMKSSQNDISIVSETESDLDSDFTLDDPISRHTSPRVVGSPIWGRLRKNSGGISSLVQSVSPPAPQITGALYHEFSCSDKDIDHKASDSKTKASVTVGDSDESRRTRPRSLSHPCTARDCSERCGQCCCGNPNDSVDVVFNVSTSKNCVDVEISYGDGDNAPIVSNGWVNTSKPNMSKQDDLMFNPVKDCESNRRDFESDFEHCFNKDKSSLSNAENLVYNSVKNYETFAASEDFKNDDVVQNSVVYVCPECCEVNSNMSNWCSECGVSLLRVNPISSKSIDLLNGTIKSEDKLPISKPDIGFASLTEPNQRNEKRPAPFAKKSVSVTKDQPNSRPIKTKAKQNARRWEKSNLAWSTFKDTQLLKPPSSRNFKNHPKKSSVVKEVVDGSRPRSTSFRNSGKRVKSQHAAGAPGSLPRSYKFREFKSKKGSAVDYRADSLCLKGIKAAERKATLENVSDCSNYGELTEMIRTNRDKPLPYLCLPDEIILRIFCHLSHSDLARCSRVCRQLERVAQDEILWRTIVLKRNHNISDEFLEKIGAKKPVSLSLIKCHGDLVTSSGLRELFRRCAENLEELNFIGCNGGQLIGESILLHVALRCNKLRLVDASWSNVGDNGVEALVQNVERLECLCLNGCQAITDRSLKVVADKHGGSLRTFEIFGCFNVSATAIKRLGQKCPNLETLNLGQCYKITSSDIGRLVSHLGSIVNLDLRGCKQARDACVKAMVKHCPNLVNLVLANCPLITDIAMAEIASNLSAVRCLDVCGCVKVTDHGVRALARSCNRLNSLDLSSTSITKKSVVLLANYCSQNLQSLKLSFCVDVTDESVSRLVTHCKRMKTLHLYGCKRLRNVKALQKLNSSLKLEF